MNVRPSFYSSTSRVFPVHKDSTASPVKFQPVTQRQASRLYHDARRFERSTRRKKNHQDGKLGRNGLAVLHAMLFDFIECVSGSLFPSYESIAERANISVRSVARGLQKLKASGVISWVRRCVWDDNSGQLQQLSNAYAVAPVSQWKGYRQNPAPVAPEKGTWGEHEKTSDPLSLAVEALDKGKRAVQAALDLDPDDTLATALGRLNRIRGGV